MCVAGASTGDSKYKHKSKQTIKRTSKANCKQRQASASKRDARGGVLHPAKREVTRVDIFTAPSSCFSVAVSEPAPESTLFFGEIASDSRVCERRLSGNTASFESARRPRRDLKKLTAS